MLTTRLFAAGMILATAGSALAVIRYANVNSANPTPPYTNWAAAATTIQDAVDAAAAGDQILVADGVYQTGGRPRNRVVVTKPITVRSVHGAAVTVIHGQGIVRCVSLSDGAALEGFTLTGGDAGEDTVGGGVRCDSTNAVVSKCVLTGNSAGWLAGGAYGGTLFNCTFSGNSADDAGGAYLSDLNNCTLTGNSALSEGGGVLGCTLNNCTLIANSANEGGGAYNSTLNNCILYYNSAPNGDNYSYCRVSYSCTTPLPTNGISNFNNAPLFVDHAGGNLRLQSNSPCINAGSNTSAPASPDLDDHPRVVGGTVDVGAYEFQFPQSLISYAWLQQYGLPINGSADNADPDADGLNNWQEWRAGTDPTNALSVLRLLSATPDVQGVSLSWQSVSGRNYFLERGTDINGQPRFLPLATGIIGKPGTTTFTDANVAAAGPFFYRVGVLE